MTRLGSSRDNSDESVRTGERGVSNVIRNIVGSDKAHERFLAFSVFVNILLGALLYSSWKDLQTQIWLRSDSLTKENAEIRGHVIAIEDLIQAYGMGKNIPRPPPVKEELHK